MKIIRILSTLGAATTVISVHAEILPEKEHLERTLRQAQIMAGMQLSNDQITSARSSGATITADAAQSDTESAKTQIAETLTRAANSSKVDMAKQNKSILDVDAAKLSAIRENLPRYILTDTMYLHARGQMGIVVSPDGNVIIALIRGLTNIKDRQRNLSLLRQYANAKQPEALNFFGYLYDVGLFVRHDARTAESFYRAAATKYAPAMYNLGIGEFYGRFENSQAGDARRALPYFERARTMAADGSGRICGWASFMNWRIGRIKASEQTAVGCHSPLAALGAASNLKNNTERSISLYSGFFASGADDAFPALYAFAKAKEPNKAPEFYLINKYRWNIEKQPAGRLAEEIARLRGHVGKPETSDNSAANSAKIRVEKFKQTRNANRMQFNTPVPYLPFRQADVEIFKRMIEQQPK